MAASAKAISNGRPMPQSAWWCRPEAIREHLSRESGLTVWKKPTPYRAWRSFTQGRPSAMGFTTLRVGEFWESRHVREI